METSLMVSDIMEKLLFPKAELHPAESATSSTSLISKSASHKSIVSGAGTCMFM
jgi:hypothetical protein